MSGPVQASRRQLLLPTIGTVGGVLSIVTGQWQGWVAVAISAVLYVLWGLRRYRGIVL